MPRIITNSYTTTQTLSNFVTDNPATVLIRGGSVIVNPLGGLLAGPHYDGEIVLTADLDLKEIAEGKYDLDVVGHYARPDVFRLTVNEQPMPDTVFE